MHDWYNRIALLQKSNKLKIATNLYSYSEDRFNALLQELKNTAD